MKKIAFIDGMMDAIKNNEMRKESQKQDESYMPSALDIGLGGATLGAVEGARSFDSALRGIDEWQNKLKGQKIPDDIFTNYVEGARNLSNRKTFGAPIGSVTASALDFMSRDFIPDEWQMAGKPDHYRKFVNTPNTNKLKNYMLRKELGDSRAPTIPDNYSDKVKNIIKNKKLKLDEIVSQVAKIDSNQAQKLKKEIASGAEHMKNVPGKYADKLGELLRKGRTGMAGLAGLGALGTAASYLS